MVTFLHILLFVLWMGGYDWIITHIKIKEKKDLQIKENQENERKERLFHLIIYLSVGLILLLFGVISYVIDITASS